MNRYEEIKEKAASIFPYKAMGEAALKQGDVRKALNHARTFEEKAKELFDEYNDMLAAAVVYLNASQFLASVTERFEDAERSVYLCHWTALLRVVRLLEKGISQENCCQLLLSQVQYCLLSFNELAIKQYPNNLHVGRLMHAHADLFCRLYHRLARINPDNGLVTGNAKQLLQHLTQSGFRSDEGSSKSISDAVQAIEIEEYLLGLTSELTLA